VSDKQARIHAVSEWLMEFSVLWAVFPLLDQLIESSPIKPGVTAFSLGISITSLAGGILLRRGEMK
jgi:hypothetical protein